MYHERLITGVAATLGAIALLLTIVGIAGTPVALPVALAFAASALLMYDQLSGRMAARVYRRVEHHARVDSASASDGAGSPGGPRRTRRTERRRRERGGFGAGPREEWTPPRDGASIGEAASRRRRAASAGGNGTRPGASDRRRATGHDRAGTRPNDDSADGPTAAEAYRTLELDPDADEAAVKEAYREKVKEVHPDTADGDEEQFMAVKAAYERLSD